MTSGVDKPNVRVELWLLVLMMALALVGIGIAQVVESGGKSDRLFLVLAVTAVGLGYLDQLSIFVLVVPAAVVVVWVFARDSLAKKAET